MSTKDRNTKGRKPSTSTTSFKGYISIHNYLQAIQDTSTHLCLICETLQFQKYIHTIKIETILGPADSKDRCWEKFI